MSAVDTPYLLMDLDRVEDAYRELTDGLDPGSPA